MAIIKREKLIEKTNLNKLIPLEVKVLKVENQIYLDIEEIEEFLKFARDSNFVYVYYYYTYYNLESYLIPIDSYSDEYEKKLKTEVRRYNKQLESLDFRTPKSVTLFVLNSSTLVGIELNDPWIDKKGFSKVEYAVEEIENEFNFEVKRAKTIRNANQKEDENQLREIIFNDTEFIIHSKNQDLRYWFLVELLEREEMKKFRYLVHPYGIPVNGKVKAFMDITNILYKEWKKS
jgi:hypothetical protein